MVLVSIMTTMTTMTTMTSLLVEVDVDPMSSSATCVRPSWQQQHKEERARRQLEGPWPWDGCGDEGDTGLGSWEQADYLDRI